ncbi:MAG: hypothetical protein N4A54_04035 [Peptostreptococcaceae bacterium]|nr:hypothetical protein [Peptostreptococcaceae bacterium]
MKKRCIAIILIMAIIFTNIDFNILHLSFAQSNDTIIVKDVIKLNSVSVDQNPYTYKVNLKDKGYDMSKVKNVDIINENYSASAKLEGDNAIITFSGTGTTQKIEAQTTDWFVGTDLTSENMSKTFNTRFPIKKIISIDKLPEFDGTKLTIKNYSFTGNNVKVDMRGHHIPHYWKRFGFTESNVSKLRNGYYRWRIPYTQTYYVYDYRLYEGDNFYTPTHSLKDGRKRGIVEVKGTESYSSPYRFIDVSSTNYFFGSSGWEKPVSFNGGSNAKMTRDRKFIDFKASSPVDFGAELTLDRWEYGVKVDYLYEVNGYTYNGDLVVYYEKEVPKPSGPPIANLTVPERVGINKNFIADATKSVASEGNVIDWAKTKWYINGVNKPEYNGKDKIELSFPTEQTVNIKVQITDNKNLSDTDEKPVIIEDLTPTAVEARVDAPPIVYEGVPFSVTTRGSRVYYGEESLSAKKAVEKGIASYDYDLSCDKEGSLKADGGKISVETLGSQNITYTLQSKDAEDKATDYFKVLPTPVAKYKVLGVVKENRKLTIDTSASIHHKDYPFNESETEINIKDLATGERATITQSNVHKTRNIKAKRLDNEGKAELLFKKEGNYEVEVYKEDTRGKNDTFKGKIYVYKDKPPIVDIQGKKINYRDDSKKAKIKLKIICDSLDGDIIKSKSLTYAVDTNNNNNFSDEDFKELDINLEQKEYEFETDKVGKFKFKIEAQEDLTPETIPEFVTEDDYLKSSIERIVEVDNLAPHTSLKAIKSQTVEILTLIKKEGIDTIQNKIADMKTNLNKANNTIISIIDQAKEVILDGQIIKLMREFPIYPSPTKDGKLDDGLIDYFKIQTDKYYLYRATDRRYYVRRFSDGMQVASFDESFRYNNFKFVGNTLFACSDYRNPKTVIIDLDKNRKQTLNGKALRLDYNEKLDLMLLENDSTNRYEGIYHKKNNQIRLINDKDDIELFSENIDRIVKNSSDETVSFLTDVKYNSYTKKYEWKLMDLNTYRGDLSLRKKVTFDREDYSDVKLIKASNSIELASGKFNRSPNTDKDIYVAFQMKQARYDSYDKINGYVKIAMYNPDYNNFTTYFNITINNTMDIKGKTGTFQNFGNVKAVYNKNDKYVYFLFDQKYEYRFGHKNRYRKAYMVTKGAKLSSSSTYITSRNIRQDYYCGYSTNDGYERIDPLELIDVSIVNNKLSIVTETDDNWFENTKAYIFSSSLYKYYSKDDCEGQVHNETEYRRNYEDITPSEQFAYYYNYNKEIPRYIHYINDYAEYHYKHRDYLKYIDKNGNDTTLHMTKRDQDIRYERVNVKGKDWIVLIEYRVSGYSPNQEDYIQKVKMIDTTNNAIYDCKFYGANMREGNLAIQVKGNKIFLFAELYIGYFDTSTKEYKDYKNEAWRFNFEDEKGDFINSFKNWDANVLQVYQLFDGVNILQKVKEYVPSKTDSQRYLMIIADKSVNLTSQDINEIAAAMKLKNLSCIWFGNSSNQYVGQRLANATNGTFFTHSNYDDDIAKLENYIKSKVPPTNTNYTKIIKKGEKITYDKVYLDIENDEYLESEIKWYYRHIPKIDGKADFADKWLDDPITSFDKDGTYYASWTTIDNPPPSNTDDRFIPYRKNAIRHELEIIVGSGSEIVKPEITVNIGGALKANRKVDIQLLPIKGKYDLDYSSVELQVIPTNGDTDCEIFNKKVSNLEYNYLFKNIEDTEVNVKARIKDVKGNWSDWAETSSTIKKDLYPISSFTIEKEFIRDENGIAKIKIEDYSSSPDDYIEETTYYIDYNNDSIGQDDEEVILNENGEIETGYLDLVDTNFNVIQKVTEGFKEETIPEFITEDDYLKATCSKITTIKDVVDNPKLEVNPKFMTIGTPLSYIQSHNVAELDSDGDVIKDIEYYMYHDNNYFENSKLHEKHNTIYKYKVEKLNYAGKYKFKYRYTTEKGKVSDWSNIEEVIAHRPPIAGFNLPHGFIKDNVFKKGTTLGIVSTAYDLDHKSMANKGIVETKYYVKRAIENDNRYKEIDENYVLDTTDQLTIKQVVEDVEGATAQVTKTINVVDAKLEGEIIPNPQHAGGEIILRANVGTDCKVVVVTNPLKQFDSSMEEYITLEKVNSNTFEKKIIIPQKTKDDNYDFRFIAKYPYLIQLEDTKTLTVETPIELNSTITPIAPNEYSSIEDNTKNNNKIKVAAGEKIKVVAEVNCPIPILQVEAYLEGEGSIFLTYNSTSKKWEGIADIRDTKIDKDFYSFNIRATAVNGSYKENAHRSWINTPINLEPKIPTDLVIDSKLAVIAETTKYPTALKVTMFKGTAYQSVIHLNSSYINDNKNKSWLKEYYVPKDIPEGNYKIEFTATTPNGNSETKIVPIKMNALKIISASLVPDPALAGDELIFTIETQGYAEKIEIVVPDDMKSKDNISGKWNRSGKYTYPLSFKVNKNKNHKTDKFNYITSVMVDKTLTPKNKRLREPYRFTVRAYKGTTVREKELTLDVRRSVLDLIKPGLKK